MRLRLVLAAVALAALLAGCSSTSSSDTGQAPAGQGGGSIAATQQTTAGVVPGYTISIPRLNETSTLVGLGLNPDKSIQVPAISAPMQAGIYLHGPMPGQKGPAVVLAHINADGHPGFGEGFHPLGAGDLVNFTTPTGPVSYKVTDVIVVPKAAYPTARVFSDTKDAEIRLETCGPGALDSTGHNYLNQTIVFGVRV